MINLFRLSRLSRLAPLGLILVAGSALAHTGHGTSSLFEGLAHPLAADHLLAMAAVGLWSVAAFDGARRWLAPLTFLASMTAAALLGMRGMALPGIEYALALSLLMFGTMLAASQRLRPAPGLMLVALAAALHGLAHGAEISPGASVAGYALGFLAATALLHGGGVLLGLALAQRGHRAWQACGALFGAAGLLLLARI